jgi:hypothetical protein
LTSLRLDPFILAWRAAIARLQLKVQSGFWLVLTEKSNSGFPVVNPAYEAAIALTSLQIGDRTATMISTLSLNDYDLKVAVIRLVESGFCYL